MEAREQAFISCRNGRLYELDREFRFFGLAAPNLHQNEGQLEPDDSNRWPDEYESQDVLESLHQIGSRATRSFGLSVAIPSEPGAHLLGPGEYCEEAFICLDRVLAIAASKNIRVIFPFIDSHSFERVRGIDEMCSWRGKSGHDFWSDEELKDDFKKLITDVLNRRNSVTGILYKDDPAILAWQLGNELDSYHADRGLDYDEGQEKLTQWSVEMAAYIKSIDNRHLVMEAGGERDVYLDDANIDILSDHYYEYWNKLIGKPWELAPIHLESMRRIADKKPLIVDEFGLASLANLESLMNAIIESGCVGGLLWSVRGHRRDGGFYYHNEGGTNVNSYHWPGFSVGSAYHEREVLSLLRQKAFEICGSTPPALSCPAIAPVLLSCDGGKLVWRGVAGASSYRIERRVGSEDSWSTIAAKVEDATIDDVVALETSRQSDLPPIFTDRPYRHGALYRVIAANEAGESNPSNELAAN